MTASTLRDAWQFGRFLQGLPAFLARRMSFEEARSIIARRMAERERNFLRTFGLLMRANARSPYPALLALARCEAGDVERLVRQDGVESCLSVLRAQGVYLTFDEYKGRRIIVRHGREIPLHRKAFDNPHHTRAFQMSTGGSTGRGRRVSIDLDHLWAGIPDRLVNDTIHGFVGVPVALWTDGLPSNGPNSLLSRVAFDSVPERWFAPMLGAGSRPPLKFRVAQAALLRVCRWAGTPLPAPEPVSLDEAAVIARWAEASLRRAGRCGVKTSVSHALRVCLAAEELSIDLTGAVISGGGEPPTHAKVAAVRRTGARWVSNYKMQEVGSVGCGCGEAIDENDQHVMLDQVALITHPREVPGFSMSVDAFHLTTLLPTARKVLLNVELDDYGVMETRECGCPWGDLGCHTHVREIRSFRKLTGEGVTLVGSDMMRIIEEELPRRFGGSPLDYQLLEEEDERGFTRVSIVVSPAVVLRNEADVVAVVLEGIRRSGEAGAMSRIVWEEAGTLRVRRMNPVLTQRGKLMPLHLGRRAGARVTE